MGRGSSCVVLSVLMLLLSTYVLWAEEKTEGRRMYLTFCSGCHGDSGKGDGPAANSLPVKPSNHTDGVTMNQLSDKFLFEIISKGGSGVNTSPFMPAWGSQLKEKQIRDIVSYIRSLAVPPYNKGAKK